MDNIQIKWWVVADAECAHLKDIVEIEDEVFGEHAMSAKDFKDVLAGFATYGLIAIRNGNVVGYCLYQQGANFTWVLNVVVPTDCRREGIGELLINRVKQKMQTLKSDGLECLVHERWLPAQLFFRSQGFVSSGTLENSHGEDAGIRMVFMKEWN